MVNGVMHIVAAVLFAVISLDGGLNYIWMGVAVIYLVTGILNLLGHAIKVKKIERAAKKAEKSNPKKDKKAEKTEPKAETTEITTNVGG